jgi:transcriptional regulator with XRE-family HTH domain
MLYIRHDVTSTKRKVGYMMRGSLAQRLRILRARRGLTLTEASDMVGITRHTLAALERGDQVPLLPTVHALAEGYAVPVEDLLVDEGALAVGKAEAPQDTGHQEIRVGRGDETEEVLPPALEHRYDRVFRLAVAEMQRDGLGNDIIAEYMRRYAARLSS